MKKSSSTLPPRDELIKQGSESRGIRCTIASRAVRQPDDPAIDDARAELLTSTLMDHLRNVSAVDPAIRPRREHWEKVAAFAVELAAAAPPLTAEQKDRLALLLQPKGGRHA